MKLTRPPVRIGPGFVFSLLERALHEGLARREFGKPQMEEVIAFFGGHPATCVYCGSESPKRWDHLVPVRSGGETVIGNMVPACSRCDDSKQDLLLEEWWESNRRYSPLKDDPECRAERLKRIQAYAAHFHYTPTKLEARLAPEEMEQLERIRNAAKTLREEMEKLIRMHGKRTREQRSAE